MTIENQSISMPLRDWLFVDAEMDNTGQNAIDDDDEDTATRASAIRKIGWDATGHITRPISEAGLWPPDDDAMSEQVSVFLTTADWRFVVEHLLSGSDDSETVGQADDAARGRALANRIAEQLT